MLRYIMVPILIGLISINAAGKKSLRIVIRFVSYCVLRKKTNANLMSCTKYQVFSIPLLVLLVQFELNKTLVLNFLKIDFLVVSNREE